MADEVGRLAEHIASTLHGVLRVSHPPTTGIGLAVRLAAAFRRAHAEISLHTVSGYDTQNAERVCAREVDIGFVYPPQASCQGTVLHGWRQPPSSPTCKPAGRRCLMSVLGDAITLQRGPRSQHDRRQARL
jgi:DNA-binding transcriptional LysR family regulator